LQIILISDRLAKARSVNLSLVHLAGAGLLALALLLGCTIALYWFSLRYAAELRIPVLQQLVLASQEARQHWINALYMRYLHRAGSASGLSGSEDQVLAIIIGSDEYCHQ